MARGIPSVPARRLACAMLCPILWCAGHAHAFWLSDRESPSIFLDDVCDQQLTAAGSFSFRWAHDASLLPEVRGAVSSIRCSPDDFATAFASPATDDQHNGALCELVVSSLTHQHARVVCRHPYRSPAPANAGSWVRRSRELAWEGRWGHAAVALPSGTVLLLGGCNGDRCRPSTGERLLGDVWRSDDSGVTWSRTTGDQTSPTTSPWSARAGFASAVLDNGTVVVMGGLGESRPMEDVWASHDAGTSWVRAGPASPAPAQSAWWSARHGHAAVVLNGDILIIGGSGNADIWRSGTAGSTWELVAVSAVSPGRSYHSVAAVPVPAAGGGAQLVLTGGYNNNGARLGDVWRSRNAGVSWFREEARGRRWSARSEHALSVLHGGLLVLSGGRSGQANDAAGDVWSSADGGQTWQEVARSSPWARRYGHAAVVLPQSNNLLLLGGRAYDGAWRTQNDAWRSADAGASWSNASTNAPWPARTYHAAVTLRSGGVLILGGFGARGFLADVWRSRDEGATWTQVPASRSSWTARSGASALVLLNGDVLLLGGCTRWSTTDFCITTQSDVWRSVDGGATWQCDVPSGAWPARHDHTSVLLPDGDILIMGGEAGNQMQRPDAWVSTDGGSSWTQVSAQAPWGRRAYHGSVVLGRSSGVLLMGGYNGTWPARNDVWRTDDRGSTWLLVCAHAEWPARSAFGLVELPDASLLLFGGYTSTYSNDVWSSATEGRTWSMLLPAAPWSARHSLRAVVLRSGEVLVLGGSGPATRRNDAWRTTPQSPSNSSSTRTGLAWLQVSVTPTQGFRRVILAPAGPDRLLQVRLPMGGSSPVVVPLLNSATPVEEGWHQAGLAGGGGAGGALFSLDSPGALPVTRGPGHLGDDAGASAGGGEPGLAPGASPPPGNSTAPLRVVQRSQGLLLCGGVDSTVGLQRACWWLTENATALACADVTCEWPARHSALLIGATGIVPSATVKDVIFMYGGLDENEEVLTDLWVSTSGARVWSRVDWGAFVQHRVRSASGGAVEYPGGTSPCKAGTFEEVLRLVIVGGIIKTPKQYSLFNATQLIDVCLDLMNGTARVVDAQIAVAPALVAAHGAKPVALPGGVLCLVGGFTTFEGAPSESGRLRCTTDGVRWEALADFGSSSSPRLYSIGRNFGAAYLAATQDVVLLAGTSNVFLSARYPILVRATALVSASPLQALATVAWSSSMLSSAAVSTAGSLAPLTVSLGCAFLANTAPTSANMPDLPGPSPPTPSRVGQPLASTTAPGSSFRASLALDYRSALKCPRAMVRACVRSSAWGIGGGRCGRAVRARVPFNVTVTASAAVVREATQVSVSALPHLCITIVGAFALEEAAADAAVAPSTSVPAWRRQVCMDATGGVTLDVLVPDSLRMGTQHVVRVQAFVIDSDGFLAVVALAEAPLPVLMCPAGNLLSADLRRCVPCHSGTYSASPSTRAACEACPRGSFADAQGSFACKPCAVGTWAATGAAACEKCAQPKTTPVAGAGIASTSCGCPIGHVRVDSDSGAEVSQQCADCDSPLFAFLNCTSFDTPPEHLPTRAGWWRHVGTPERGDRCLASVAACVGGPLNASCAPGHEGVLCMSCESGWAWRGWAVGEVLPCVRCDEAAMVRVWFALTLALVCVVTTGLGFLTETGAALCWNCTMHTTVRAAVSRERKRARRSHRHNHASTMAPLFFSATVRPVDSARSLMDAPLIPLVDFSDTTSTSTSTSTSTHTHTSTSTSTASSASTNHASEAGQTQLLRYSEDGDADRPVTVHALTYTPKVPGPRPDRADRELQDSPLPSPRLLETPSTHSWRVALALWSRSSLVLMQLVSVGIKYTEVVVLTSGPIANADDARSFGSSLQQLLLVDLQGLVVTSCLLPSMGPLSRLLIATALPLLAVVTCVVVAAHHMRRGNALVRERCLWLASMVAACTATNAQSHALSAFACRSLNYDGHTHLLSDPRMLCSGPEYATYALLAGVMVVVYCIGYPLLMFALLKRASREDSVPSWLQPVTTGMKARVCTLETVEVVQRVLVVFVFVMATRDTSRVAQAATDAATIARSRSSAQWQQAQPYTWSLVAAMSSALLQLIVVFLYEYINPFVSKREHRTSTLMHFTVTLCMLQFASMTRSHWLTAPTATWGMAFMGVLCIGVLVVSHSRHVHAIVSVGKHTRPAKGGVS